MALDWSKWILQNAPKEDAWLLVDFPGYADCEGSPTPGRIRETLKTVVPLAAGATGRPDLSDKSHLRFFGHSLGSAACLIAATEFGIQRGVLISPFTSAASSMENDPLRFLRLDRRVDDPAKIVATTFGKEEMATAIEFNREMR